MQNSLTSGFLKAFKSGDPFVPIPVNALRLDAVTNFDLYIELRPDEPLVLYARRDIPFTEDARKRLEDNEVQLLYVDAGDEPAFRVYLETHLPAILKDPEMAIGPKAEILYVSAQGLARDLLNDPRLDRGIARGKDIVENTVNFLLSQPEALRHLIETASLDYFAYTHSVNACVYGIALVQRSAGPGEALLKTFGHGALMRDLGMSQLDKTITETKGKLTPQQFEIIKQHPALGEKLLSQSGGLDDFALDVVRHHHEKIDGTGYPDGIAGDEISPYVRASTVADVFDALSTDRPHRKALSTFNALGFMRTKLKGQIDDDMLRVFIELMGKPVL